MIELINFKPLPLISLGLNPNSGVFATDFRAEQGKNYLLTAPSGKGKSTLLHSLYGIRKDYEGKISLNGTDIQDLDAENWADQRQKVLSIVFQDLRLFSQLTAFENIWLKAELQGWKSREQIVEMTRRLGIDPLLDQAAATLSYGQLQRVAIIRALCQPFEYLLLDEPFSHLDEDNTRAALELIREECRLQGAGLLLVSLGETFGWRYERVVEL